MTEFYCNRIGLELDRQTAIIILKISLGKHKSGATRDEISYLSQNKDSDWGEHRYTGNCHTCLLKICITHGVWNETFDLTAACSYYSWVNRLPWLCPLRSIRENNPDAYGGWQVPHYGRSGSWGVALRLLSQWRVCQHVAVTPLLVGGKAGCSQVPVSLRLTPLGSLHPWTRSGASIT